jgi:anthranilate 1,2-dioxygenase small subunit
MQTVTAERLQLQYLVTELNALHAELIDDDRLEDWLELFVANGSYRVISRENFDRDMSVAAIFCDSRAMLTDRIVSLRRANIYPVHHYRHILGPSHILTAAGNGISAQTNYVVLQTRNDGQTTIYNTGKYLDRLVMDNGRLRFSSKQAVFDTNLVDTLMVRPI